MVEEGARSRGRDRFLDRLVRRCDLDDEVRAVEIAVEARGPSLDGAEDVASRELLEEVLDQVLLGEPLDELDLLDRDRRLVRGGMTLRRYRVKFPQKTLRITSFWMPDGKIEQFQIAVAE